MNEKDTTAAAGPKALRIGVIQGVRVIEERILPRKGAVTFGTGDGNTFSFAASDLARSVTLFELGADGYELLLDESTQGRLESPEGKKDFTTIKATAKKEGAHYRIPVPESAKGRIRLSPEITVLFHFVPPPPVAVAPVMPPEVSASLLKSVEPIFTAVLTASFLVHFGFGIFIKVTEPPAPPSVDDLKQLVERIQPPKVEAKLPTSKPTPTDTGTKNANGKGEPEPGKGKPSGDDGGEPAAGKPEPAGGGGGGKADGGSGGAGNRDAVRQGIAGKGILQLIGGRAGGGGGAVGSVFSSGGSVSDDIGGALAGTAGVGIAGGAGGGAGVTRRGTGGGGTGGDGSGGVGGAAAGIGVLSTGGGGSVDTGSKQAAAVVARVQTADVQAVDGKVDTKSVGATIRRRQEGFQACYETALKANSKLAGKLIVEFTIGEDGQVTEARVAKDGIGSAEVSSCIMGLLRRLKFPKPADGEVTISIPFVFQPS